MILSPLPSLSLLLFRTCHFLIIPIPILVFIPLFSLSPLLFLSLPFPPLYLRGPRAPERADTFSTWTNSLFSLAVAARRPAVEVGGRAGDEPPLVVVLRCLRFTGGGPRCF